MGVRARRGIKPKQVPCGFYFTTPGTERQGKTGMDFETEALEKLKKGYAAVSGQKETAMKQAVREALESFIRQDGEFAQAVAQGGTFADCMKAVAKDVGSSISDLDAYKRAVQFYFPGAEIRMTMTVDLIGAAGEQKSGRGVVFNLEDFL